MASSEDGHERAARRREWARLADLSTLGLVFPVALVLGYLAGRYVGGFFEAQKLGGLVGALVGIVAGFYNLIEVVRRLERRESQERDARREEQGRNGGD